MDDTDLMGRVYELEKENERLWQAMDELMRDQVKLEERMDRVMRPLLDLLDKVTKKEEGESDGDA